MTDALSTLASRLREEETPISPHVIEPDPAPDVGLSDDYALVVEAVREGYLLHYGEPRLLAGHDANLGLLAGDYLYALGIERLAALGDAASVKTLADLIAGSAQLHTEGRDGEVAGIWSDAIAAIQSG